MSLRTADRCHAKQIDIAKPALLHTWQSFWPAGLSIFRSDLLCRVIHLICAETSFLQHVLHGLAGYLVTEVPLGSHNFGMAPVRLFAHADDDLSGHFVYARPTLIAGFVRRASLDC